MARCTMAPMDKITMALLVKSQDGVEVAIFGTTRIVQVFNRVENYLVALLGAVLPKQFHCDPLAFCRAQQRLQDANKSMGGAKVIMAVPLPHESILRAARSATFQNTTTEPRCFFGP